MGNLVCKGICTLEVNAAANYKSLKNPSDRKGGVFLGYSQWKLYLAVRVSELKRPVLGCIGLRQGADYQSNGNKPLWTEFVEDWPTKGLGP